MGSSKFFQVISEIRNKLNRLLYRLDPGYVRAYAEGKFIQITLHKELYAASVTTLEPANTQDVKQQIKDWIDNLEPHHLERYREGNHLVIRVAQGQLPNICWYPPEMETYIPKKWVPGERV